MTQKIASSPTFQYLCLIHAKIGLIFAGPWNKTLEEEQQVPLAHPNAMGEATAVVAIYSCYTMRTHHLDLSTLSKAAEGSGGISINISLHPWLSGGCLHLSWDLSPLCPVQWLVQAIGTCHLSLASAVEGYCSSNYFAHQTPSSLMFVCVFLTTRSTIEPFKRYGRRAFFLEEA